MGLQFKDNEKPERAQCRAAMKATGLEERLKEGAVLVYFDETSSRGIYWEPATTLSDKDDVIKLFTDDMKGTMAQNWVKTFEPWKVQIGH